MKPVVMLALPALALAAVTPKVEERQLPIFDLDCLRQVAGIADCVAVIDENTSLADLLGCPANVVVGALLCLLGG
ncbi:hypothetical protein ACHAPT_009273 [Fusarium lateritium]